MANNTDTSVIYVDGEATGVSGLGVYGTAIPVDDVATSVDALRDELVASGVLPA